MPSSLGQFCRGAAYLIQNYNQSSKPPNIVCRCPTLVCRYLILYFQHPTTVENHPHFLTFSAKSLHNSNKSRTFASTELVCIPLELQASHFFIINYESESKNNSAADSHTHIKRDGFQRRKPRHLIYDKNQLFPSKVLLDGYD